MDIGKQTAATTSDEFETGRREALYVVLSELVAAIAAVAPNIADEFIERLQSSHRRSGNDVRSEGYNKTLDYLRDR